MVESFEAVAVGGVIRLPAGAPSSAHCIVTILGDVDSLREQAALTLPQEKQERMSELLEINRDGTLSERERDELDALAEEFDLATLTKGRALAALAQLNGSSENA